MIADTTDPTMTTQYHGKRRITSVLGILMLWQVTSKTSYDREMGQLGHFGPKNIAASFYSGSILGIF